MRPDPDTHRHHRARAGAKPGSRGRHGKSRTGALHSSKPHVKDVDGKLYASATSALLVMERRVRVPVSCNSGTSPLTNKLAARSTPSGEIMPAPRAAPPPAPAPINQAGPRHAPDCRANYHAAHWRTASAPAQPAPPPAPNAHPCHRVPA